MGRHYSCSDCEEPRTRPVMIRDLAYARLSNPSFGPQHVLVMPTEHRESLEDLTAEEVMEIHNLTRTIITVLKTIPQYEFTDFVIWENEGSGRSATHYHRHIIPNNGQPPYPVKLNDSIELSETDLIDQWEELFKAINREFHRREREHLDQITRG